MSRCSHEDDYQGPDGCEARGRPDVHVERQAVLCGPSATAALRAEREQRVRLAAAALIRDQRLVAAIRKAAE